MRTGPRKGPRPPCPPPFTRCFPYWAALPALMPCSPCAFDAAGCPDAFAALVECATARWSGASAAALSAMGRMPKMLQGHVPGPLPQRRLAGPTGAARRLAVWHRPATEPQSHPLRPRRRRHGSAAANMAAGPAPDPLDEMSARELLAALDEQLARLPERYRLPLLLVHWQGLTQTETAARLRCSEGAIKGRLEHGRKLLADTERRGFVAPATCSLRSPPRPARCAARPHRSPGVTRNGRARRSGCSRAFGPAWDQRSPWPRFCCSSSASPSRLWRVLTRCLPSPRQRRTPSRKSPQPRATMHCRPGAVAHIGTPWLRRLKSDRGHRLLGGRQAAGLVRRRPNSRM